MTPLNAKTVSFWPCPLTKTYCFCIKISGLYFEDALAKWIVVSVRDSKSILRGLLRVFSVGALTY